MSLFGTVDADKINTSNQNQSLITPLEDNPVPHNMFPCPRSGDDLINEYFGYQVLAALGINVPDCYIGSNIGNDLLTGKLATYTYIVSKYVSRISDPQIKEHFDRAVEFNDTYYRLDSSFRIAPLANLVINDTDGNQHFFTKINNRLYRFDYDREAASTEVITSNQVREQGLALPSASIEQIVAFTTHLNRIIQENKIEAIFDNSRVKHTPEFERNRNKLNELKEAWTHNAQTIAEYLNYAFGEYLDGFQDREQIRRELAEKTALRLNHLFNNDKAKIEFINNLIEDLRCPYYFDEPERITRDCLTDASLINKIIDTETKRYPGQPAPQQVVTTQRPDPILLSTARMMRPARSDEDTIQETYNQEILNFATQYDWFKNFLLAQRNEAKIVTSLKEYNHAELNELLTKFKNQPYLNRFLEFTIDNKVRFLNTAYQKIHAQYANRSVSKLSQ